MVEYVLNRMIKFCTYMTLLYAVFSNLQSGM